MASRTFCIEDVRFEDFVAEASLLVDSLSTVVSRRVKALRQSISDAVNAACSPPLALWRLAATSAVTARAAVLERIPFRRMKKVHVEVQTETLTLKVHQEVQTLTQTESLGLHYIDTAKRLYGTALGNIEINTKVPAALATRFATAWTAAMDTHDVRLLLHGSPEHNIDSILEHGVRGRAACNTRWLTSCPITAAGYARGAQRMVVCATLLPKVGVDSGIFTINRDEHHLPLFVAQRVA